MARLVLAVITVLAVLAVACSDDDDGTTASPSATPTAVSGLKPADADSPAAGVCPGPSTFDPGTVEFHEGIPAPRCLRVLPSARLRFMNDIDREVNFEIGSFTGTILPGGDAFSSLPAGQFLAPGLHTIRSTAYGDGSTLVGSGEIWLVDESAAPSPVIAPWQGSDDAYAADRGALLGEDMQAWAAIDPLTGEPTKLDPIDGLVPRSLAGGRFYLAATDDGTLIKLDIESGTTTNIGAGWSGYISPDGQWAAVIPEVEGSTLQVVNLDSGQRFDLGQLGKPVSLAWSTDDTLAIIRHEKMYTSAGPSWLPKEIGDYPYGYPVWSADSKWLTTGDQHGVRLISSDLEREQLIGVEHGGVAGVEAMAWSQDGRKLAIAGVSGYYMIDFDRERVTKVAPNTAVLQDSARPAWSPDGTQIALYVSESTGGASGIAVANADGSGARMITTGLDVRIIGWTNAGIIVALYQYP